VARLHVECLVPGVDVADDAVDPVLGRRMLVGQQLGAERAFALLGFPAVAIGDEEALVAGQAADHRRLAMLGDVTAVGGIGDLQAAEIAEVLAKRQLSLDVHARHGLIAIVLAHQRGGVSIVLPGGRGRPPIPDRKSTRLNSSHVKISYAVFCLKKKKKASEAQKKTNKESPTKPEPVFLCAFRVTGFWLASE